jgi:hypothetical protein
MATESIGDDAQTLTENDSNDSAIVEPGSSAEVKTSDSNDVPA